MLFRSLRIETSPETVRQITPEAVFQAKIVQGSNSKVLTRDRIIQAIAENSAITQVQLAARLGMSRSGIKYVMKQLQEEGILKREGSTKKGKWIIQGDIVGH